MSLMVPSFDLLAALLRGAEAAVISKTLTTKTMET